MKGLIRCGCGSALTPTHTAKGRTRYRYYRCAGAQGRGSEACGAKPVPAGAVERFVVDRIRAAGRDPELLRDALDRARAREQERVAELDVEGRGLARDLNKARGEVHRLSLELEPGADNAALVARLADLHERIGVLDRRAAEVRTQAERARGRSLAPEDAARALAAFDPVWDALRPDERAEVLALLVERVEYDGRDGRIAVTFHPDGPAALVAELNRRTADADDQPQTIRLRERA